MKLILPFCILAMPALADGCPPAPDRAAEQAAILDQLAIAGSEAQARNLSAQLWQIWTDAPDQIAQAMLDDGMGRRSSYDFLGARRVFDRLIAYCPDYAEGYNQRAFALYLGGQFADALIDLDRALALSPTHVAALSGKALTLIGLGREAQAQEVLQRALRLNPWLAERALLSSPLEIPL